MIIVRLIGGLGNQMFQYALGRSLAERHSSLLKLDISSFEGYTLRPYGLSCFRIWEDIATQEELSWVRRRRAWPYQIIDSLYNVWDLGQYLCGNRVIKEKGFRYDNRIKTLKAQNTYLRGYWQSEKYFSDIRTILLREFEVKYDHDEVSQKMLKQIQETASVSIHVRRGDYVSDPKTNKVHGVCNLDYYHRCIQAISQQIENPHFYVFSDDLDWAATHLKSNFPMSIVSHNGNAKNYEDLRLMSRCKHNIIANSSFSWWGAWLNQNPDKRIFAPNRWFKDTSLHTDDLVPKTWFRL